MSLYHRTRNGFPPDAAESPAPRPSDGLLGRAGAVEVCKHIVECWDTAGSWSPTRKRDLLAELEWMRVTRGEAVAAVDSVFRRWKLGGVEWNATKVYLEVGHAIRAVVYARAAPARERRVPDWVRAGYPSDLAYRFDSPAVVEARYPAQSHTHLAASSLARFLDALERRCAEDPDWTMPGWLAEHQERLHRAAEGAAAPAGAER